MNLETTRAVKPTGFIVNGVIMTLKKENAAVPTKRLRTVNSAYEEIVNRDPNTALTKHAIRTIIKEHKIASIDLGHKIIFDLGDLEKYLEIAS